MYGAAWQNLIAYSRTLEITIHKTYIKIRKSNTHENLMRYMEQKITFFNDTISIFLSNDTIFAVEYNKNQSMTLK